MKDEKQTQTKRINIFDKRIRKIRCIETAHDYLGNGTIINEARLERGRVYTYTGGKSEPYGSVVFLKEVRSRFGFQAYLFEEMEEYDVSVLQAEYQNNLLDTLEKSVQEYEQGRYMPFDEAMEHIDS